MKLLPTVTTLLSLALASVTARQYKYLDYAAIKEEIFSLQSQYPNLVRITTAQEEYGLPSPGDCGESGECLQYIVHLTNFDTYEAEKETRPEVFFSGTLHGNERVGPTTLVEYAKLLINAHVNKSNPWLARLVDTRSIWFTPMTNAIGYYQNVRTENGVDINRDFPIDYQDAQGNYGETSRCMRTIGGRALNELFRDHMFQLAITFHSGTRALGYEYGDYLNEVNYFSPDDYAQASIASSMSAYAGAFDNKPDPDELFGLPDPELFDRFTYLEGPITPIVYPVSGGMEDWAYAGSWAENQNTCNPTEFGGYPKEKTQYSDSMLRVFNMLLESDWNKEPDESELGSDDEVLSHEGSGMGQLPRHIRLTLTMTDAVQPYVKFVDAVAEKSENCAAATIADIGSFAELDDVNGPQFAIKSSDSGQYTISYDIGGSFTVNETYVRVYKLQDYNVNGTDAAVIFESPKQSGFTRWSGGGLFGSAESSNYQGFLQAFSEVNLTTTSGIQDRDEFPFIPSWKACIDLGEAADPELAIVAFAVVDQNWAVANPDSAQPGLAPQAHVTQARTNASWDMSNNGFRIKGQTVWSSKPLFVLSNLASEETKAEADATIYVAIVLVAVVLVVGVIVSIQSQFSKSGSSADEDEKKLEVENKKDIEASV